jgi:peptidoglycan/LPS O-acetylase OafA/YrhL
MVDTIGPAKRYMRSIPSLDGLRACSIALVFLAHLAGTTGAPVPYSVVQWVDWGNLGVRVFFVISGFLITSLLLAESDRTGTINLRAFYWRRTLRIFPPYYVFLAAMALLAALRWITLPQGALAHAAVYLTNYGPSVGWYLGHSWSLSVEEQFYLLWPAAMLLAGLRRAWMVALAVIILCPLIRVAEYHILGSDPHIAYRFETTADALAIGCLLAYVRTWLGTSVLYAWLRRRGVLYILPAFAICGAALDRHPHLYYALGLPAANVSLAFLVDWTVRDSDSAIGRLLNASLLTMVGRMSYSLYLWQQLFLNRASDAWYASSPVNLIFAITAATLSYWLVEQPVLRLRRGGRGPGQSRLPGPQEVEEVRT